MAGMTEFAKELTTSDNIAARTLYGGPGADMIAASQKMIFDWVPDAGNSKSWSQYWYEDRYYWDDAYQDYMFETVEVWSSGSSPSTASGTVSFDTPAFGQSFTAEPVAFTFNSREGDYGWGDDLARVKAWGTIGEWAWNPDSGTLDPMYVGSSRGHNAYTYYESNQVSSSWDHYSGGRYEDEHGHWRLRETGDLTAFGGAGNNRIHGGTGNDRLFGEEGDDEIHGGLGTAFLSGGQGKDLIIGGVGAQVLDGGSGNDLLTAGHGRQVLDGGSGNDTLRDGLGETIMTGGAGADTFVFGAQSGGSDKVLDFDTARDHILLDGIAGLTSLDALPDHTTDLGGSTLLDLGEGHTVLLMGVDAAHLTAQAGSVFAFA